MFDNKALQMDPHVSRLVNPVTEYSANKGSSGFSSGHWPSMDMAGMLLTLEQGSRPLEGYIQEYLDLAHFSDLLDCVLIDFFCQVKSSHLYLYSAFNNTNCDKATAQYQNGKIVSIM